jgi:RNA polymerase sigma-70 factor (ECF subfamily)
MVAMAQPTRLPAGELDLVTLERARRGDRAAFASLLTFHQKAVFALLSRLLYGRDRATVEDVAQETFLRLHRALPDFQPNGPAKLSSWILTIATRLGIDELRRARLQLVPLEQAATHAATDTADASAIATQQRTALTAAIAELSPDHRAAFLLREAHGLEYEEIARALDVDVGTVKSRLSRAKEKLRAALAPHAEGNVS